MLYKVILALLMSLELVVVLISLKYLHQSNVISKEFAAIFDSSREEVKKLFQEIKNLSEISSKKENYILHMKFHAEETQMYVRLIYKELQKEGNKCLLKKLDV
jgi:hypothetical protein